MYKQVFFYISICFFQCLVATNSNIDKYLEYLPSKNFGQIGDYTKGEMQIVDTYDEILEIQNKYYNEFLQKGYLPEKAEIFSRVGVVSEDKYWIWFRDPLILPNGKTTAYNRFFPKSGLEGPTGVSIMGISKENQILVNVIFRHATRQWELELPRGGRERNETAKQAALREFEEETGIRAKKALKIASVAADSGVCSYTLDLFVVRGLSSLSRVNRDDCEVIHACLFLSKKQLKQAFIDGFIDLKIDANWVKVFCRDSYLASALLIAEAKGML